MSLSASSVLALYKPAKCERRFILASRGEPSPPPGPFEELILELGRRWEEQVLAALGPFTDLRSGKTPERIKKTQAALKKRTLPLVHPLFTATFGTHPIVGEPDILVFEPEGAVIRDVKLARNLEGHPEIAAQLSIYAWLFLRSTGSPPYRLEVVTGSGEMEVLPLPSEKEVEELLSSLIALTQTQTLPYEPVGWTKCGRCGYRKRCWTEAEESRDVALIPGVSGKRARELRESGIVTIEDFVRSGSGAGLSSARALAEGKEIVLSRPELPPGETFVMFDLEGIPAYTDDMGKIYLWGMKVFGEGEGTYLPSVAGFGRNGDYEGWERFLDAARGIFREFGDLPFVHWAPYERGQIHHYIERYGDPDGTAARVRKNLVDLLPITKKSVALPVYSYSLKEVEKHVGFKRTQKEYGGDWSMAQYIRAVETEDLALRDQVMAEILTYNREDLEATWAVFRWLRAKA